MSKTLRVPQESGEIQIALGAHPAKTWQVVDHLLQCDDDEAALILDSVEGSSVASGTSTAAAGNPGGDKET